MKYVQRLSDIDTAVVFGATPQRSNIANQSSPATFNAGLFVSFSQVERCKRLSLQNVRGDRRRGYRLPESAKTFVA